MENLNDVRSITDRLNKLCNYIEKHGFRAYALNGKIRGEMVYSAFSGSYTLWETIEPTWSAVREWLGY